MGGMDRTNICLNVYTVYETVRVIRGVGDGRNGITVHGIKVHGIKVHRIQIHGIKVHRIKVHGIKVHRMKVHGIVQVWYEGAW